MRVARTILFVLMTCQLWLGGAWAHSSPRMDQVDAHVSMAASPGSPCHDAMDADAPSEHAGAACCSAIHCPMCSAVLSVWPNLNLPTPPDPHRAPLRVSGRTRWSGPPELRPPI